MNGRRVPILIADHALQAVRVPAGISTVGLSYQPAGFQLGLGLCALVLGVVVAGLALGRWRQRQPAPRDSVYS